MLISHQTDFGLVDIFAYKHLVIIQLLHVLNRSLEVMFMQRAFVRIMSFPTFKNADCMSYSCSFCSYLVSDELMLIQ